MQIVLTSIARRWYNVIKRRCFNVKIVDMHLRTYTNAIFIYDVHLTSKTLTLKRRCKNVENANRLYMIPLRRQGIARR